MMFRGTSDFFFDKTIHMKAKNYPVIGIPTFVFSVFFMVLFATCKDKEPELIPPAAETAELKKSTEPVEFAVEAPPFSDGIFPCNECHEYMDPNPQRRELVDMHDEISGIFDHDSENRWCLDCHDINNRDSLRLANGKLLDFKESYKLCGQCHGDKLRDWKVGVHGKRTGYWNGKKEYLLCVHCHNPHTPKFKPLTPMPPPMRQEDIN